MSVPGTGIPSFSISDLSTPCLPVGMAEYYSTKVEAAVRASRSARRICHCKIEAALNLSLQNLALSAMRHHYRRCNIQVPDAQAERKG